MRMIAAALLALLAAGCGASLSGPSWQARMPGLWLEERPEMAVFYWFKPDGTGERLRRSQTPGAWKEQVPTLFRWSVADGALTLAIEGEPPRALGPIVAGDDPGVIRFGGADATWFGCGSGKLPSEFAGLCDR